MTAANAAALRALTIRQPWAWAIAAGHKRIENRGRPVSYRGQLAIHAAQRPSARGIAAVPDLAGLTADEVMSFSAVFGAVIAVAELVDCHAAADDCCRPWGDRDYNSRPAHHWVLGNVRRLDVAIPCRGALGLWRVPADIADRIPTTVHRSES